MLSVFSELWQINCSALEKDSPVTLCHLSIIDVCNSTCFPIIYMLFTIFATLPVSTATAERSFSVLKVYWKVTCDLEWEKNIHSDSFDYRSIADDVVDDFFLMIQKTCCTTADDSATQ